MRQQLVEIDGSQGEGGGQMLRTSLALSMRTGRAFRIFNIRANRDKPGLARQHLTAVLAAAEICAANVRGAEVGSRELIFEPGEVRAGEYRFSIGTAGSTTLVLQAVLPALMTQREPSLITLEGGTHNAHAPPIEYLERVYLPLLARMGPRVSIDVARHGFYPRGGGRWHAEVTPSAELRPIELGSRGTIVKQSATAIVAGLRRDIAERELAQVGKSLDLSQERLVVRELSADQGPGNAVVIEVESEDITEIFSAVGARGVTAEAVAASAVQEAREYLASEVPVGPHLADQLLIPFAIAGGGAFVTSEPTMHTRTNIDVIRRFLGDVLSIQQVTPTQWRVTAE